MLCTTSVGDFVQHLLQVACYLYVGELEDVKSPPAEPTTSRFVLLLLLLMDAAVDLYQQLVCVAAEIDDEAMGWMPPAELEPVELSGLQPLPQHCLDRRQRSTKRLGLPPHPWRRRVFGSLNRHEPVSLLVQ